MWICRQCGLACNALTCLIKYGNLPKQSSFGISTFHIGTCECCGREEVMVTEDRDFFYPETKYLNKKSWASALKGGK